MAGQGCLPEPVRASSVGATHVERISALLRYQKDSHIMVVEAEAEAEAETFAERQRGRSGNFLSLTHSHSLTSLTHSFTHPRDRSRS